MVIRPSQLNNSIDNIKERMEGNPQKGYPGIPDIGIIYPYKPNAKTEASLRAIYTENGRLQAWNITRRQTVPRSGVTKDDDLLIADHTIIIEGWAAVLHDDERITEYDEGRSERRFTDLIEEVRFLFPNGEIELAPGVKTLGRALVRAQEQREFGGVLCHHTEIELMVKDSSSAGGSSPCA